MANNVWSDVTVARILSCVNPLLASVSANQDGMVNLPL